MHHMKIPVYSNDILEWIISQCSHFFKIVGLYHVYADYLGKFLPLILKTFFLLSIPFFKKRLSTVEIIMVFYKTGIILKTYICWLKYGNEWTCINAGRKDRMNIDELASFWPLLLPECFLPPNSGIGAFSSLPYLLYSQLVMSSLSGFPMQKYFHIFLKHQPPFLSLPSLSIADSLICHFNHTPNSSFHCTIWPTQL